MRTILLTSFLASVVACSGETPAEKPPIDQFEVNELVGMDPAAWVGKDVKVHGHVKPGSIRQTLAIKQMITLFVIEQDGKQLRVLGMGRKPDILRDNVDVMVSGKLARGAERAELLRLLEQHVENDPGYILDATDVRLK